MNKYLLALFLACGGLALVRNQIKSLLAKLFAYLIPFVVALLHRGMAWVVLHPAAREVLAKNSDFIIELLELLLKGFEDLLKAAEEEIEKDVKAAAQDAPPAAPPAESSR